MLIRFVPIYLIFAASLLLSHKVYGRSSGAPFQSCQNLKPKHGPNIPQPLVTNPYKFNVTLYPLYGQNEEFVHVELYSVGETFFRGFVVQARLANNQNIIVDGNFVPSEDFGNNTRVYICKANEKMKGNNTWTHLDNNPKRKVSSFWFPEDTSNTEEIIFLGTLVQDVKTYWIGVNSTKIKLGDSFIQEEGEREVEEEVTSDEETENDSENKATDLNDPENEEVTTNGNYENEEQPEPSNNVDRIVSAALSINPFGYSSFISLIISLFIYRTLI